MEEIPSLSVAEKSFTEINFSRLEEFSDYLKFPTLTLPQGTVLCHSAYSKDFYDKDKGVNLDTINWWNEYFPGHASYGGGWFTFETSYGGPNFGLNLYYRLQDDLTLPFIPNDFADKYLKSDPRYFSQESRAQNKINILHSLMEAIEDENEEEILSHSQDFINIIPLDARDEKAKDIIELYNQDIPCLRVNDVLDEYSEIYSGSHILEGVEDWEVKGYLPLTHPESSYADNLALRVAELGFNGYISCDECEVYITHAAMQRVLKQPFNFDFSENLHLSFDVSDIAHIIEKSFTLEKSPLNVTNLKHRNMKNTSHISIKEFLNLV